MPVPAFQSEPLLQPEYQIPQGVEANASSGAIALRKGLNPAVAADRRKLAELSDDDPVWDASTFSKNRHCRFRNCDLLRQVFEPELARGITEDLVSSRQFEAGASLIKADASQHARCVRVEVDIRAPCGRGIRHHSAEQMRTNS